MQALDDLDELVVPDLEGILEKQPVGAQEADSFLDERALNGIQTHPITARLPTDPDGVAHPDLVPERVEEKRGSAARSRRS